MTKKKNQEKPSLEENTRKKNANKVAHLRRRETHFSKKKDYSRGKKTLEKPNSRGKKTREKTTSGEKRLERHPLLQEKDYCRAKKTREKPNSRGKKDKYNSKR